MAIAAANAEDYTSLQRGLILATATLATTLYATTILVVSVILPQMQGALSATQDQIAWVVTFNILAQRSRRRSPGGSRAGSAGARP